MSVQAITQAAHYITFRLGDESFAVDVARVREVLDLTQITRVPTAPPYMRGVINVRGSAIPVVDLRLKFGLEAVANTVNTRILVLELDIDDERAVVGGLADSVHEVVEIEPNDIGEPPRIAMRWRSDLILGMVKRDEQFLIILDIARVFANDEQILRESIQPGYAAEAQPDGGG
jgi:purine-binding chemotaxis protein CheW